MEGAHGGIKNSSWASPRAVSKSMTIELFKKSGWKISTTSRSYFPSIDDADDTLQPGAPSRDVALRGDRGLWMSPSPAKTGPSKTTRMSTWSARWFIPKPAFARPAGSLAVPQDSPIKKIEDLNGKRISTEMVNFTKRYFAERQDSCGSGILLGRHRGKSRRGTGRRDRRSDRNRQHDPRRTA